MIVNSNSQNRKLVRLSWLVVTVVLTLILAACGTTEEPFIEVNGATSLNSFTLINADSDSPVRGFDPIKEGATIDLSRLPTKNLSIRANTSPAKVGSVRFGYNGNSNFITENHVPYGIAGDYKGDYKPWTPKVGAHTVSAVPYGRANGGGTAGRAKTVRFTVVDGATKPGFTLSLINADTDKPISGFDPIREGATLDLSKLPTKNLNIRANTSTSGSLEFALSGQKPSVENHAPYALAGDYKGDYKAWQAKPGSYTLSVTPYSKRYRSGSAGAAVVLRFKVVGEGSDGGPTGPTDPSSPPPPPPPPPPSNPEYDKLEQVHVSVNSGSDRNPGTSAKPLKTLKAGINKAVANRKSGKGTRVVVHNGTYREELKFFSSSGAKIVVQARERGKAVVSGADRWSDWSCRSGVCSKPWDKNWGTASNPWPNKIDVGQLARRRELVVVNGKNLDQAMSRSGLKDGTFYVDEGGNRLYIDPPSGTDLNRANVEVGVRGTLFRTSGFDNFVLDGLTFQYSASAFRDAALSVSAKKDVLLANLKINRNGQEGLSLHGKGITIRNTEMNYNGSTGITGIGMRDLLMEDNETSYNNWRGDRGDYHSWEIGNKFLKTDGMIVRRHKSVGNLSRGFWFDWDVENVVVEDMYACNNLNDGLHIEASQGPITIKKSTFCKNGVHGIHTNGAYRVTMEGNNIYDNKSDQIKVLKGRRSIQDDDTGKTISLVGTKYMTFRNNKVSGPSDKLLFDARLYTGDWNDFISTSKLDGNRYTSRSREVFRYGGEKAMTLDTWRKATGQARSSTYAQP